MSGETSKLLRSYRDTTGSVDVEQGTPSLPSRPEGVPKVHIVVTDDNGNDLYRTWQDGPLDKWDRATLYFRCVARDLHNDIEIGLSVWD